MAERDEPLHSLGQDGIAGEHADDPVSLVDALRLADAITQAERDAAVDLDPREDPELAALLATATDLRATVARSTETRAFHSFHQRSRAAVLHALEPAPRHQITIRRSRAWFSLAGAAAAAAIAVGIIGLPSSGGGVDGGTNLTVRSTSDELNRLAEAVAAIEQQTQRGEPVAAPLLRDVAESTARMSNLIEQRPDVISRETVQAYEQAARSSAQVLGTARADSGAEGALAAAQRAARDGTVVASAYLRGSETATLTATGTSTATPATSPSATPSATPAKPAATPTGTPTTSDTVTR